MCSAYHDDERQGVDRQLDLSIIVVSYNTREMTLDCLASIAAETVTVSYEVIVVDNNSSDQSAAAIARQFPDVRLFTLDSNVGFARANNLAAKQARGRRLLLLNPDTIILDCAIDQVHQTNIGMSIQRGRKERRRSVSKMAAPMSTPMAVADIFV